MTSTLTSIVTHQPSLFRKVPATYIPDSIANKYGVGLSMPLECFNKGWRVASGESKIRASIYVIIMTPLGTRISQPDFGSMVPYLVFNPYGAVLKSDLEFHTRAALTRWEPRIIVQSFSIDESSLDADSIGLTLEYLIKGVDKTSRYTIPVSLTNPSGYTPPGNFTVAGNKVF